MIYRLKSEIVGQGSEQRIVYGVEVYQCVRSLPCVMDERQALAFLSLCEEGQPAVEHIDDVLRDFLVSETVSTE